MEGLKYSRVKKRAYFAQLNNELCNIKAQEISSNLAFFGILSHLINPTSRFFPLPTNAQIQLLTSEQDTI